ncbi:MAG: ChbG/HpnK family deacetylase [Anaerolineales bacterium]|nr:MAG: ChbG/HpnK family deacetylase [Anaerolineales bacterium]
MSYLLIVNADDYARTSEVSAGIREAHLRGIVTTTTVLINLPGALEMLHKAAQATPALAIGLHLNLTLGEPCWKRHGSSALVGDAGQFHPLRHWYEMNAELPISWIEAEWRAQMDRMLSSGIPIDHLDSHHHIAAIRADVWQLHLELAQELNCGVRPPFPNDTSQTRLQKNLPSPVIETARDIALPALKQSTIPHPDAFLASFFDDKATLKHLLRLLKTLPPGISEIMCHPGYSSPDLVETSGYSKQRQIELEALTDDQTLQTIRDKNIELVTYRQVWRNI